MHSRIDFASAGPVASGLLERLMRRVVLTVEGAAKAQLYPGHGVKAGTLRRDIVGLVERAGERGRVGTSRHYAMYVHEGTGIHGPKHQPFAIRAKRKKALFWPGAAHPVKRVMSKGQKGIPFLREGLAVSRDSINAMIRQHGEGMLREVLG